MSKLQQVRKQNPAKPNRTDKTVEYGSRILNVFKVKKKPLIRIVLSFQNKIYKLQYDLDITRDKLRSKNTENRSLKKQRKEDVKTITSLQKKLERSQKREKKHKTEIDTLQKTNKGLKANLKRHDNSNTPSSAKPPGSKKKRSKIIKPNTKKKKQGGQKGHVGKTFKPKATRTVEHKPDNCNNCGSNDLKVIKTSSRNITEVTKIITKETVCHRNYECECKECGQKGIISDSVKEIPKKGNYGKNVIKDVVLGWVSRTTINMIATNSERNIGLPISTGTIQNILFMIGFCLELPAMGILAELRKSKILHMDETSYSVMGKRFWVWTIHDPYSKLTYFTIRHSRGAGVVSELLPGWKGVLVCDGWKPYKTIKIIQRCMVHILREAKDLAEKNPDVKLMYEKLCKIYADAKKPRSKKDRKAAHASLNRRVQRLVLEFRDHPELTKYMDKLERARPDMFRFVLDPRIPSENNPAERALREIVVHRKIRGALRSLNGVVILGNILTCATTWKATKPDWLDEIVKYV